MEYDTIHDTSYEAFITRVNQKLSDGWEPVGGVDVCPEYENKEETGFLLYSQAIVKR